MKKDSLLLTVAAVGCCSFSNAEAAGLSNADFAGADNGASYTTGAASQTFELKAGTTNLTWNKLNVDAGETLNFNFLADGSTAFNQVNSAAGASVIAGRVASTGAGAATSNVIINNPAGVSFVNGAVVNVGALAVESAKTINFNGVTVEKGDISLTSESTSGLSGSVTVTPLTSTAKSSVKVNGVVFEQRGNLTVKSKGDVVVSNVKNADKISVASTGNFVWIQNDEATTVNGQTVDGITAEYVQASVGGNVRVNGKVTVGKDFFVLTNGVLDEAGAQQVVLKNGTVMKYNADGGSSLFSAWGADIQTVDGDLVVVTEKGFITDNSKVDDIYIKGTNSSSGLVIKVGSAVGDVTYEGNGGVRIYNGTSDIGRAANGTTTVTGNMKLDKVYNLTIDGAVIENPVTLAAGNVSLKDTTVTLADNATVSGYLTMKNSSLTAKGLTVKNVVESDRGTLNLTDSSVGTLAMNDTTFAFNNVKVSLDAYFTKDHSLDPIYSEEIQALADTLQKKDSKLYIGYMPTYNSAKKVVGKVSVYEGDVEMYSVDMKGKQEVLCPLCHVYRDEPIIRRREDEENPAPAPDEGNENNNNTDNTVETTVTVDTGAVQNEDAAVLTRSVENVQIDTADLGTVELNSEVAETAADGRVSVERVASAETAPLTWTNDASSLTQINDAPEENNDSTHNTLRNAFNMDDDSRRYATLRTAINEMNLDA